ncbi:MAG: lysine exporter LysO family protein [Firmicutes bacterium]|nr:lysine exporter LysO family protein [Bacillota bacterium]
MLPLLLAVCLGIAVGWVSDLSQWNNTIHILTRCFLLLMLFSLGAKLGTSTHIHGNLAAMGLQALVFSILTVAGSILAVYCLSPLLRPASSQMADKDGKSAPISNTISKNTQNQA